MQLNRLIWVPGLLALLGIWSGCAGKIDPILLEPSQRDAQNAISNARRAQAEDYAKEQMAKAVNLLQEAQQAQQAGNGIESLELAFQSQVEAQIAEAEAHRQIAQQRIDRARLEISKAIIQEMEYKVQASQNRQAIADERANRAVARAARADQRAMAAQAEAEAARVEAQKALFRSQTQLAIEKAQLVLDAAKDARALIYAVNDYKAAENLIDQAKSLLNQDNFDQAKATAAQAEERATAARIAAIAGTNVATNQAQSAKLEAYTNAKVAITKAQAEIDRADKVNAFKHAEAPFQRAKSTLEEANTALQGEQYEQALRLAAQAGTSAREAYAIAEVAEKQRLEREAREEKIAHAKDAIFKAEEGVNREARTQVPILMPGTYEQAKASLANAKSALADGNYERAITLAEQSAALITQAIEKSQKIETIETRILNAAKAIPDAETERNPKGILIRFSGNLFAPGASEITPKYFPMLGQLAEIIKTYADYKVRIEGHSDSSGDSDTNLRLTEKRANGFMKYLSQKCGVPASRMTAVGLGESHPIANDNTPAGRDKNRRIDTLILTRE